MDAPDQQALFALATFVLVAIKLLIPAAAFHLWPAPAPDETRARACFNGHPAFAAAARPRDDR